MSPDTVWMIIVFVFLFSPFVLLFLWLRSRSRLKKCIAKREKIETRFSSVLDVEKETEKALLEQGRIEKQIDELRSSYREKKSVYNKLAKEVSVFDESSLWPNWVFTARILNLKIQRLSNFI